MSAGIYVHIPFCRRKCSYCDFYSVTHAEHLFEGYKNAVISEISAYGPADAGLVFDTVFFGGGTPSLLPAEYVGDIMAAIKRLPGADIKEATIEANPDSVSADKCDAWLAAGINRISIGLQSASDRLLKRIGRLHDAEGFYKAVRACRAAGFDNINADLMFSLPGQNMDDWTESLHAAAETACHISAYALTLSGDTPLGINPPTDIPDEDADRLMYHTAKEILGRKGFCRYEISNYAKPGRECLHNLHYWHSADDYLGIGAAAHGKLGGTRYANPSDVCGYIANPGKNREVTSLTEDDMRTEEIMLSLRLSEGLDTAAFLRRFGTAFSDYVKYAHLPLMEGGFLRAEGDIIRMTDKGLDVFNEVLTELLIAV